MRMLKLKRLIHKLPEHHFETFKHLAEHLSLVASYGNMNKVCEHDRRGRVVRTAAGKIVWERWNATYSKTSPCLSFRMKDSLESLSLLLGQETHCAIFNS